MKTFTDELRDLINRHSIDNELEIPDYILAEYIEDFLAAYKRLQKSNKTHQHGEDAYDRHKNLIP